MARSTMALLIEELRGMTEAGTADYTAGTTLYWSDDAMQDVLDLYRREVVHAPMAVLPRPTTGGTLEYFDYESAYTFFEQTSGGSSIFYLQDSDWAKVGTALYTPDYRRGRVVFGSDTGGTSMFITGRSYDMNAAAAEVWRRKAAHVAPTSFNFSTDNHSISREQVYLHCKEMANYFEGRSGDAITMASMYRGDISEE